MAKMKVAQVPKPGADFEIVEREIPNPAAGTAGRTALALLAAAEILRIAST